MLDRRYSLVRFVIISGVLLLVPVPGFGQTEDIERRPVEMREKAQKWRANRQLIQEQVRQESMRIFYLKDDLQLADMGRPEIIWIHDPQRYRYCGLRVEKC